MRQIVQNLRKLAERLFVIHKKLRVDLALRQKLERTANVRWRVMEAGLASDFRIV